GAASNNANINVVVVDGTTVGAAYNGTDTITVTLDIANDPTNSQVSDVAAAIDALAEFTTSNVVSTDVAVGGEATVGGALTGGFDADAFTISGAAAERLGLIPAGSNEVTSATGSITAEDRNTLEVDSAFNTLIRLRDALEQGDVPAIGAAVEQLDVDLNRAVFAESEVGARVQTLGVLETRLEDEEVQLRETLSEEIDVDLTEAISEFTARQYALQASLQTTANLLQLTLLNFI
ncbi:MAG: hypothetical protein AAF596_04790, partial [Planctomycetota bacterium]